MQEKWEFPHEFSDQFLNVQKHTWRNGWRQRWDKNLIWRISLRDPPRRLGSQTLLKEPIKTDTIHWTSLCRISKIWTTLYEITGKILHEFCSQFVSGRERLESDSPSRKLLGGVRRHFWGRTLKQKSPNIGRIRPRNIKSQTRNLFSRWLRYAEPKLHATCTKKWRHEAERSHVLT